MSDISEQELNYLLNSEDLGEKAYFLATVSSWLNLRILDMLFKNERATAGEIARGINVDMTDAADSLRELQNVGLVSSEKDEKLNATYWHPVVSEINIVISDNSELRIEYSMNETDTRSQESPDPQSNLGGSQINPLGRVKRTLVKYGGRIQEYVRCQMLDKGDNSLAGKNVHTVQDGSKWTNRVGEENHGQYDTQKEAAKVGREIAKRNRSEHHLHSRNGQIREHRSYRNDPSSFSNRD